MDSIGDGTEVNDKPELLAVCTVALDSLTCQNPGYAPSHSPGTRMKYSRGWNVYRMCVDCGRHSTGNVRTASGPVADNKKL